MSNKLIIEKKQRNLLVFSNFIRNSEEEIYLILQDNLSISENTAEEKNIKNKIKNNLAIWLDFSRKEWKSHDKNPFLINDSDSIKNCELCNSPLKWRFELYNEISKNKISIGGECVKQFKQLEGLRNLVKNEEQYKRYSDLINEYPQTLDVLQNNKHLLDSTEIILPNYYQETFNKIEKKFTKLLKDYIKKGIRINQDELEKSLRTYSHEIESIREFIEKHQGNREYLSRGIVDSIKRNQKSDSSMIISTVEGSNGIISIELSPKIKVVDYLKLYENEINIKFRRSDIEVSEINHGVFIIQVKRNKNNYKFKLDSKYLLTKHHKKMSFSFPENFKEDIEEFIINDSQTKERLFHDGQRYLLNNSLNDLKNINYKKIISLYDSDLTKDEYNEIYQKVTRILSNLLVISKVNTKEVEIFMTKDVESIGRSVLFGIEPDMQEISFKMNETAFYEYIANQID